MPSPTSSARWRGWLHRIPRRRDARWYQLLVTDLRKDVSAIAAPVLLVGAAAPASDAAARAVLRRPTRRRWPQCRDTRS